MCVGVCECIYVCSYLHNLCIPIHVNTQYYLNTEGVSFSKRKKEKKNLPYFENK